MMTEKELPKRKNLRLQGYDYSTPGVYFITICTHNRKNTLSHIVGDINKSPKVQLTAYGQVIDEIINQLPTHFNAVIDRYVIMPNHAHFIVVITDEGALRAIRESPLRGRSMISKILGYIKMNASKQIRQQFGDITVWQRGFYDHVIRSRQDYVEIAQYIDENPQKWQEDALFSKE